MREREPMTEKTKIIYAAAILFLIIIYIVSAMIYLTMDNNEDLGAIAPNNTPIVTIDERFMG